VIGVGLEVLQEVVGPPDRVAVRAAEAGHAQFGRGGCPSSLG
jgi:hypothetical protein